MACSCNFSTAEGSRLGSWDFLASTRCWVSVLQITESPCLRKQCDDSWGMALAVDSDLNTPSPPPHRINNNECWWGCRGRGEVKHQSRKRQLMQTQWRSIVLWSASCSIPGMFIQKVLSRILQRILYVHIHCCAIHNNQDMETVWVSSSRWEIKHWVHLCSRILLSCESEWSYGILRKPRWTWMLC